MKKRKSIDFSPLPLKPLPGEEIPPTLRLRTPALSHKYETDARKGQNDL